MWVTNMLTRKAKGESEAWELRGKRYNPNTEREKVDLFILKKSVS